MTCRPASLKRPGFLCCQALALGLAVLLEAGCASSDPPLRYHALSAVAPSAPAALYDGPVLQIADVRLPPEFDRMEWLRESESGQFEVSDVDQWAAPPAKLARQVLAQDLALRLSPGRTAFPGAAWPVAEAHLSVDILKLSVRGGQASMLLSWSLTSQGAAAPQAGAQLRLEAPATDEAAALSALLAKLSEHLANAVAAH